MSIGQVGSRSSRLYPIIFIAVALLTAGASSIYAQDQITGTWYRNDLFASATLKIDKKLHFHINAFNTAHSGEMDGALSKVEEGLYYSVIKEPDIGESCIMVFELNDPTLKVKLFGDEVGAGATVYFEGNYERKTMPYADYVKKALDWILKRSYGQERVEKLLGSDLDYFIQCFEMTSTVSASKDDKDVVREGFLPGVANYQNGVFEVKGGYVYILFLDCRPSNLIFQYYTNDPNGSDLTTPLKNWIGDRKQYPILKHVEGK